MDTATQNTDAKVATKNNKNDTAISTDASPQNGLYRHYKGNLYLVYAVAQHSETDEQLVVYQPQYGDRKYWVRPTQMFMETVTIDGITQPRFEFQSALPIDENPFKNSVKNTQPSSYWRKLLNRLTTK